MLNPKYNREPSEAAGPLALPPRELQLTDFNYILKQWRTDLFLSEHQNAGLLLFKSTEHLPRWIGGPMDAYHLHHPLFLFRDGHAAQLYTLTKGLNETKEFSLRCLSSSTSEGILIERSHDWCVVRDPHGRLPEKVFTLGAENVKPPKEMALHPLPAYPRVLLHSDAQGFVCFAFEYAGAYPKMATAAQETVEVRGFQGLTGQWREFEVFSTRLTGAGFGDLFFQTELGTFRVPGVAQSGKADYTDKRHNLSKMRIFDVDKQQEPRSKQFSLDAYKALRSLGLPGIWPPEELLA